MSRTPAFASIEASPAAAQPLLAAVKKQLGSVPNLFRVIAHSPAALEGYLGLNAALGEGTLAPATRERIALAVAEINGCGYCLAAHSYLARNLAKLDDDEAAVHFAARLVESRGHATDADVAAVGDAGYDEAQILEIVMHVALNTLTNYVNEVAQAEIDFPVMSAARAA